MIKQQETIFPTSFRMGERVEVMKIAPSNVYGFGRIETECAGRPGWYWIRFPQGELDMINWAYLIRSPE